MTRHLSLSLLLGGLLLLGACAQSRDGERGEGSEEGGVLRRAWELRLLRDPATGKIPEGIGRAEREYAAALDRNNERRGMSSALNLFPGGYLTSPTGGRTRALGIDARGADTIIAGGVNGGMWRSGDRGRTWTRATLGDEFPSSSCLVQDARPGHEDTWYAGTGELIGGSAAAPGAYYLGDGLFKSTDNGRSWSRVTSTVSNTPQTFDRLTDFVWRVATDPSNSDAEEVYTATYGAIMRSTNGGATWANVRSTNGPYSPYTDVAVTDSGGVYAALSRGGSLHGVWRSANGTQWARATPPDWPAEVNRVVLGIAPSNQNIVYLLAETPGTGHVGLDFRGDSSWATLWRYDASVPDSTQRWANLSANLPSFGGSFGDFNPQSGYDLHVAVDPRDENIVYIGGTNLYRSTNGFRSPDSTRWIGGYTNVMLDSLPLQMYDYPNHHPDQHGVVFEPGNPDHLYSASDGGLHRADLSSWKLNPADTLRWESLNPGYKTSQFYAVALSPNAGSVAGGLQDNGTWMRFLRVGDTAWRMIGSGDGGYCSFTLSQDLYISKQQGRMYRLLLSNGDSVESWTRVDPLGPTRNDYDFINPFVTDQMGKRMYLPVGRTLWRNTDLTSIPLGSKEPATAGWERLDSVRDPRGGIFSAIALRNDRFVPGGALWLGTDSGSVLRIDDPTAANPVVHALTDSAMPRGGNVNCIWIDPLDTNRVVVVFSNYSVQSLWLTRDNGATWSTIGGNLEQNANGTGNGPSCRWFQALGSTTFMVATSTGLYTTPSLDGPNTTWTRADLDGVSNVPTTMIAVGAEFLAVATHGNGVYVAQHYSLGVDHDVAATGGSVRVAPNPVREGAQVELSFVGTSEREASVELVDGRGKVVMRRAVPLVAGRATLPLDLQSEVPPLPAGVYQLSARAGARTVSTSVSIVR